MNQDDPMSSGTVSKNKILLASILIALFVLSLLLQFEANLTFLFLVSLVIVTYIKDDWLYFESSPRTYGKDVLIFMAITYLGWGVIYVLDSHGLLPGSRSKELTIAYIISAVFFSPVVEEFFHRHIVMKMLSFLPVYVACVISGLAFYLTHGRSNIGTLFAGTYWAYLYQRDKSLIPCIFLHVAHNFFTVSTKIFQARVANISDNQMLWVYLGLNAATHFVFYTLALGYLRFQRKGKERL